jgi:hypothetical protein
VLLTRGRSVEDGWLRPGRQLAALEEAAHDLTAHRVEQPHDHAAVARWVWLRCGAWWVVEHLRPRPCRGTTLKQEPIELVLRWSSDHRHVCVVWRVACAPATRHARCTRPSPSLRCASLSSGGKTRSIFFGKRYMRNQTTQQDASCTDGRGSRARAAGEASQLRC